RHGPASGGNRPGGHAAAQFVDQRLLTGHSEDLPPDSRGRNLGGRHQSAGPEDGPVTRETPRLARKKPSSLVRTLVATPLAAQSAPTTTLMKSRSGTPPRGSSSKGVSVAGQAAERIVPQSVHETRSSETSKR